MGRGFYLLGSAAAFSAVAIYRLITHQSEPVAPDSAPMDPTQDSQPNLIEVQPGFKLALTAAAAFQQMEAAAQEAGVELPISTAYRSRAWQEQLYKSYLAGKGPLAAKPGRSLHEKGLAVDIHGLQPEHDNYDQARAEWLTANAASFGFYNSVKSEPWHWAYGVKREGVFA